LIKNISTEPWVKQLYDASLPDMKSMGHEISLNNGFRNRSPASTEQQQQQNLYVNWQFKIIDIRLLVLLFGLRT